jgi:hypothetical protein
MKKTRSLLSFLLSLFTGALLIPQIVSADITNPVLDPKLGGDSAAASSGQTFSSYFVYIWQALIFLGGFLVILNLVWGAVEWIMSGGEKGAIEKARNKITNAVIGMIILSASFVIIKFVGQLFGFDILKLSLPTP